MPKTKQFVVGYPDFIWDQFIDSRLTYVKREALTMAGDGIDQVFIYRLVKVDPETGKDEE